MTELQRAAQRAILHTMINEGRPALLGRADGELYYRDGAGAVVDANRVWARVGAGDTPVEMVVYCSAVAKLRNLPVIVADRNGVPTVIKADTQRADLFTGDNPLTAPAHAGSHGRYGTDPIYVSGAAFVPGIPRPAATPGLSVAIERINYRYLGTAKSLAPTSLDLSSYVPDPVFQRFVVVYLNRVTNAVAVVASTPTAIIPITVAPPFTIADVLPVVAGLARANYPLAAIRLYNGQTRVIAQDIFLDLRLWAGELEDATLAGLGDVVFTTPSLGDLLYFDGTDWVNAPFSATGIGLDDLDGVSAAGTDGRILAHDAGAWLERTLAAHTAEYPTPITVKWIDKPLLDTSYTVNTTSQFDENTGFPSFPTGWTDTDPANNSLMNDPAGFWHLEGLSGIAGYQYDRQTNVNVTPTDGTAGGNHSFWIGPCYFTDAVYLSDVEYFFWLLADDSGAPDEDNWVRVSIIYDASADAWKATGESCTAGVVDTSTALTLSRLPLQPLTVRINVLDTAFSHVACYIGHNNFPRLHRLIYNHGTNIDWGDLWMRISATRSTIDGDIQVDTLLIAGIDFSVDL